MANSLQLNARVRELGLELFERADRAQPTILQKAWWLEQMTRMVESDERLKTQAFEFVECLPALQTDLDIARHMREYLDPRYVQLPKIVHAISQPGPLLNARAGLIGQAARFGAGMMAGRFIAGENAKAALQTIARLRRQGMCFTLDVLGESTTSDARAEEYLQDNVDLVRQVAPVVNRWRRMPLLDGPVDHPMPRMNLSVKLTNLDPYFDPIDPRRAMDRVGGRLRMLLRVAREHDAFINVDMESFKVRDLTLDLFKQVLMEDEFRDWPNIGIVVQAYLVDSENDLQGLIEWGERRGTRFAVRLVKGAYWDAETAAAVRAYKKPPVWTRKWESDACYERMAGTMLSRTDLLRPAFASHNVRSLAFVMAAAEQNGLSPYEYEVQNLFGMGDPLKTALVKMGQCCRVYLPTGAQMPGMGYLIRRLLENTSNDGFLKQAFGDRGSQDELLTDPAIARPPSSPLPARKYQNTDPEEPMIDFTNASNTNFASPENRDKMIGAIGYVRGEVAREYPLIIGGESITTGQWHESVNPAKPSEIVGRVACAGTGEADRAVAAAVKASREWGRTSTTRRADLLRKLADRLEARRFELAATMVLECGKPWREADADVTEAVDHCRYYAAQIEAMDARPRRRQLPGEDNLMIYSPKGVCVVISPWAFPLAILTGMATAALASGNALIIKPARQASVSAAKLVEAMIDVGFGAGVVNFLAGEGAVVGQHLVEHGDVHVVAFTGSTEAGSAVIQAGATTRPGQRHIKKMIVDMGGKNAIIVDDDADMDGAISAILESAFVHAGQKCSSCSRAIVLAPVYEEFCRRLKAAAESLPIGPAEAPATWVGPVIDAEASEQLRAYAQIGKQEGRLFYEASLPEACADGFFSPPRIFVDVDPKGRLAQEEVFGPILSVICAVDFDDALRIANDVPYALTGGLFSRSPAHIGRARREFAVGNLYINRRIIGSQVDAQPFGGFKLSGTGVKAGSPEYLHHFMDARCITENTQRSGLVADESSQEAFTSSSEY